MSLEPTRAWKLPRRRDTIHLGQWLADGLRGEELIILSGDLGAGKTFLTRAILRRLGVGPEVRVTSPTFNLIHEFRSRLWVLHADLYRIADPWEVEQLGLRQARREGAAVIAEWATAYEEELGGDALIVRLDTDTGQRVATLRATGTRSLELLRRDAPMMEKLRVAPQPE